MEPITNHQNDVFNNRGLMTKYMLLFSTGVLVVSMVLGGVFGFGGAYLFQKYGGELTNPTVTNKTISLEQSAIVDTVKKTNPAVVSIIISAYVEQNSPLDPNNPFGNFYNNGNGETQKQVIAGGSGFIVTSDGLIVTNKHVASDTANSYKVILSNGKSYDAKIVSIDPTNDISIIKVNATGLPTLNLGDSSNLELGQMVIAIGNALGQYRNSVSMGVVSGLNRSLTASDQDGSSAETLSNVIQTDASINPGNSGGPLLDLSGDVIGMNTAIAQNANGIGFAIPINQIKKDIQSVQSNGKIVKPQLGVRYEPIDSSYLDANPNSQFKEGAIVISSKNGDPAVVPDSPADKVGIKEGDIILAVDGTKLDTQNNPNALSDAIQKHGVGDTVTLHIYKASSNKEVDLKVTLNKSF